MPGIAAEARSSVTIRRARPEDTAVCGRICYEAFYAINTQHNFPPDLPSAEAGTSLVGKLFSHPRIYCVVAEMAGRIAGSNCLDERCAISGVGPITVDPASQNTGIGRKLMQAVLDRAWQNGCAGVRLVQAAFHNRSLSLYTTLGFDSREPLSCMQGPPLKRQIAGSSVRPAQMADLENCNRLCCQVHGHDRSGELSDAIGGGTAVVVERDGRITGYSSALAFFGHSAGESNVDLQALIASAESFGGSGILVPSRNAALFRWCLENGLRVVQPMTLMTMGLYNEPAGAWLPSIIF
jgi:GNAT superfamily N-acetyltransferase